MLSSAGCRDRVRRLVSWCRDRHVDLAVISNEKEVHYFSGFLRKPFGWLTTRHAIWGCFADGTTFLVCSESEKKNAKGVIADHLIPYRDYSIDETTQTFLEHALRALREHLSRGSHGVKRIALEERYAQVALRQTLADMYPGSVFTDVADAVLGLRKRKDPDEVELLRRTAGLTGLCYFTAGDAIVPGRTDTEVYADCCAAYVRKMGEYVTLAGDYLAGEDTLKVTGGPSGRVLEPGQTMILDLWIDPYGYWVDNARTFIVGDRPSKDQERLYDLAIAALSAGEGILKPGVRGKDVYHELRRVFEDQGMERYFQGHAGHGLGLSPHEAPLFIPASEDVVETGDVCTLEPGLYVPGIGGVRCEDNYLVTPGGPERLTDFERKIRWYKK
jgi:Xaa-Pro dipeptidase